MNTLLLELGKNSPLGRFVASLGVPVPPALRRFRGAWPEFPLQGRIIAAGGGGSLHETVARTLYAAGATECVCADEQIARSYRAAADAHARGLRVGTIEGRLDAIVFDGTSLAGTRDLASLHEFTSARVRSLSDCGRIVIIGRPPESRDTPLAVAAHRALEGFVRSLAKEVGYKGATCNLILVADGAEDRLEGTLRFLLSDGSAFITGQPFRLGTSAALPERVAYVRALEGKTALLTGAARGIGAASAAILAAEGARVVCLDRPQEGEELARTARSINGEVLLQDLGESDAPQKISNYLKSRFGGADIVVHNAGVTRDRTLGKMTPDLWNAAIDVNLGAVINVTEALLSADALKDHGRIVCLSSIAGISGNFGQTNYAASKAGLIGYVQSLAARLAARASTANAVAPGFIETKMTAAVPLATREAARWLAALSQGGLPHDVGQAIAFLASPGSAGLSGQTIRVCGGNFLGA